MADEPRDEGGFPEFISEIEYGHDAYTDAELLEQCQANAQALILALFGTVIEDEVLMHHLVDGVASRFTTLWDAEREWEAAEVLDALLTNLRSLGAAVESVDLASASPHASLAGLPDPALAEMLAVPAMAFRPMLVICERITTRLGWQLTWSHETTGRVTLQVTEPS